MGWALSRKLKGRQFHSQSVHMPGSWARSPVGGWQEATNQCSSPSLSASPLSKIQSINTVLEMSISSCHSAARSLQPSLAAQCGSPDPSRGLPRCLITFPGCFPSPFKTSLKKRVRYLLGMLALHSVSPYYTVSSVREVCSFSLPPRRVPGHSRCRLLNE